MRVRMVWSVAWHDIAGAVRNRTIQGNLVAVVLVVVLYRLLPLLSDPGEARLVVHDVAGSATIAALEDAAQQPHREAESRDALVRAIADSDVVTLGIIVPARFDEAVRSGSVPVLEGYVAHWGGRSDVAAVTALWEERISALAGHPVRIDTSGRAVYPRPDSGGRSFTVAIALVLAVTIGGVTVVAHLMLEEKQTGTIEVLLLSPASIWEVALGKAVAGQVYCCLVGGLVLALNAVMVVHWGLALLATAAGALFAVSLGLLLGQLFASRQQMVLWGFAVMNVLLVPAFLSGLDDIVSPRVLSAVRVLPTTALAWLLRIAQSERVPWTSAAQHVGLVLLAAAICAGLLMRRLRAPTG